MQPHDETAPIQPIGDLADNFDADNRQLAVEEHADAIQQYAFNDIVRNVGEVASFNEVESRYYYDAERKPIEALNHIKDHFTFHYYHLGQKPDMEQRECELLHVNRSRKEMY